MELLQQEKARDVLKYVVAYLLLIVTAVVAGFAIFEFRNVVFVVAAAASPDARLLRVVRLVNWILPVTAWGAYVLLLEHTYREAVTQARIRSARKHPGVEEPTSALFRFLRRFDLDMLGAVFLKFFPGTLLVFILLFGLRHLLLMILPG